MPSSLQKAVVGFVTAIILASVIVVVVLHNLRDDGKVVAASSSSVPPAYLRPTSAPAYAKIDEDVALVSHDASNGTTGAPSEYGPGAYYARPSPSPSVIDESSAGPSEVVVAASTRTTSVSPTRHPTTDVPTDLPTYESSLKPSASPSALPSATPSESPTWHPTDAPTDFPTNEPSLKPTKFP